MRRRFNIAFMNRIFVSLIQFLLIILLSFKNLRLVTFPQLKMPVIVMKQTHCYWFELADLAIYEIDFLNGLDFVRSEQQCLQHSERG